jgi:hypothetical protein
MGGTAAEVGAYNPMLDRVLSFCCFVVVLFCFCVHCLALLWCGAVRVCCLLPQRGLRRLDMSHECAWESGWLVACPARMWCVQQVVAAVVVGSGWAEGTTMIQIMISKRLPKPYLFFSIRNENPRVYDKSKTTTSTLACQVGEMHVCMTILKLVILIGRQQLEFQEIASLGKSGASSGRR